MFVSLHDHDSPVTFVGTIKDRSLLQRSSFSGIGSTGEVQPIWIGDTVELSLQVIMDVNNNSRIITETAHEAAIGDDALILGNDQITFTIK